MKFSRDIVIVDVETTGTVSGYHEIIQLSAVRLDKKILKEIDSYSSFVRPKYWQRRTKEAMRVNGIDYEQLRNAQDIKQVINDFVKKFPSQEIILGNYGGTLDFDFLATAFRRNKLKYPYDYHTFNLWALVYAYLAVVNYKYEFKQSNRHYFTGFRMPDVTAALGITTRQTHDALDDCRLEAEIFRKILSKINVKDSF